MNKNVKREIMWRLVSIIYTTLFMFGSTWLWFGPRTKMIQQREKIESKYITYASKLELLEQNEPLNINKQKKLTDEEAMNNRAYKFSIKNNSGNDVKYLVSFRFDINKIGRDGCNIIPNNYINYRIKKNNEKYSEVRSLSLSGKIYADQLRTGETVHYSIQYWIDDEAYDSVKGRHFHSKIALINDNYS